MNGLQEKRRTPASNHHAVVLKEELDTFERLLRIFTKVRPGEGRSVALFFLQGFLLLFSYYIIRALREGFILTGHSAAERSHAVALAAGVLMLVIPLYGALRRRFNPEILVPAISVFFVANLVVFYLLWLREIDFGFAFFVWVGLFGLLVVSQFWAFAADTYKSAGQLKRALRKVADDDWASFQLYYHIPYTEVKRLAGPEFIETVCAVFDELTAAMNCVVEVPILSKEE